MAATFADIARAAIRASVVERLLGSRPAVVLERIARGGGAMAPAARPVRAAWDAWAQAWSADPNAVLTEDAMLGEMASQRRSFAGLIGATAGQIALTDNTSRAANIAVRILAAKPRGHVVVDDGSYPSSVYPWHMSGREVRYVPSDEAGDPTAAVCRSYQ